MAGPRLLLGCFSTAMHILFKPELLYATPQKKRRNYYMHVRIRGGCAMIYCMYVRISFGRRRVPAQRFQRVVAATFSEVPTAKER